MITTRTVLAWLFLCSISIIRSMGDVISPAFDSGPPLIEQEVQGERRLAVPTDPNTMDEMAAMRVLGRLIREKVPSWSDGGDPCADGWAGVTCKEGRVTLIDLKEMDLGSIPGVTLLSFALPELTYLEVLLISRNNLTGASDLY